MRRASSRATGEDAYVEELAQHAPAHGERGTHLPCCPICCRPRRVACSACHPYSVCSHLKPPSAHRCAAKLAAARRAAPMLDTRRMLAERPMRCGKPRFTAVSRAACYWLQCGDAAGLLNGPARRAAGCVCILLAFCTHPRALTHLWATCSGWQVANEKAHTASRSARDERVCSARTGRSTLGGH